MSDIPDIEPIRCRFNDLDLQMAQPDFFKDSRKAVTLSREHQKLQTLLALFDQLQDLKVSIAENESLVSDSASEPELKELAREELTQMSRQQAELTERLLSAMIPPEQNDSLNTVMEIRAGAGGDEASLFASDLYRLYCRYAEDIGWKVETLSGSPSECGGYKEVIFLVSGEDVFKNLKFESGVHRVQRVPSTEASGRIHTSTATVAVLPEAREVDIEIDPGELDITVCRASGPGGQGVNTTDSAVQILHKPTGLIVQCADERSQLKNKNKALKVLRARLLKIKQDEERAKYSEHRRSQIGTGDRSERIRTYNFPQGRLTDHRIGLTLYNLPEIMEGHIGEVIDALQKADREQKVRELTSN